MAVAALLRVLFKIHDEPDDWVRAFADDRPTRRRPGGDPEREYEAE